MTVVDLDGLTGQPKWQLAAEGIQQGSGVVYCYPDTVPFVDEPKFAVRADGTVVIAAMINNGLPPLSISDGTGINIDPSTCTDGSGVQFDCFSPEGPPIVNTDGSTYMEYEVRQIDSSQNITSAVLWLLEIAPNDSITRFQLSSTTDNTNLLPGRIIPDGQGGVLATWTVAPVHPPTPPTLLPPPYQVAHVVSGAVENTYGLPFSPKQVTLGMYPTFVLGENGTAFVTDGMDSNNGPQIVSFDLSSGTVNWSYQAPTQSDLSFVAAVAGGGVVAKDTSGGDTVIRFDTSGNSATDSPSGLFGVDYWTLGRFFGDSSAGFAMIQGAPIETSMSAWAFDKGSRAKNNSPNLPHIVNYLPSRIEAADSDPLTTATFQCKSDQLIRNTVGAYGSFCPPPSDPTGRVNQVYKARAQATVQAFRADVNKPLDALAFFGHSIDINQGTPQEFAYGITFYYPIAPGKNPGDTATWDHTYFANDIIGSSTPETLPLECL